MKVKNKFKLVDRLEQLFKSNPDKIFTKEEIKQQLNLKNIFYLNLILIDLLRLNWIKKYRLILNKLNKKGDRVRPFFVYGYKANYKETWSNLSHTLKLKNG